MAMPNNERDVGKEIDSAEPSDEVKRAIARDFEMHANERPIQSSDEPRRRRADPAPDSDEHEETTRPLNPPPETHSTRRASDDERPGS